MRVLIKLAELAKLAALTGPPAVLTVLGDLSTYLRDTQAGRDPNFAHFAEVELERSAALMILGATYPRLELARWARARDLVRGVVDAFARRLP